MNLAGKVYCCLCSCDNDFPVQRSIDRKQYVVRFEEKHATSNGKECRLQKYYGYEIGIDIMDYYWYNIPTVYDRDSLRKEWRSTKLGIVCRCTFLNDLTACSCSAQKMPQIVGYCPPVTMNSGCKRNLKADFKDRWAELCAKTH